MSVEQKGERPFNVEEMHKSIAELEAAGLETRIVNALVKACGRENTLQYLDLRYLSLASDKVLLGIQGLGEKSLNRIRDFLVERGLMVAVQEDIGDLLPSLLKTLAPGETLIIKRERQGHFRVEKIC